MLTSHDTVANKFYDGWQHPKTRPTIRNIFYVAYSGAGLTHLGKFSDYRYALIKLLKCLNSSDWLDSNKVGNTQMMFHGTKRSCSIADNPQNVFCCTKSDCSLCSILRGSYNMERAKGGEFLISFPIIPILIGAIFVFVSKNVWPWNLLITSFLQSRYLHRKRECINEKPSHDRQSSLPWTNEDDVWSLPWYATCSSFV